MLAIPPFVGLVAVFAWPLALGLTVVLWSKVRAAERVRREAALGAELRGLYRMVEGQAVPERLALVVEALEEADAMAAQRPRNGHPGVRQDVRSPVSVG